MELSYWESRWKKDKTGFHMPGGYSALKSRWPKLTLPEAPAVLVPLCGKSADMIFMENQGAQVTGVEISEKAVRSFFKENERNFETDTYADFTIRWSGNIQIWQGDFMKFPDSKADVDLIYDKAALVALPPEKRQTYTDKLLSLAGPGTQILLHHFMYPQQEMPGPPFSVGSAEINTYFSDRFSLHLLEENEIPSGEFIPFQRRGLESPLIERFILMKPR